MTKTREAVKKWLTENGYDGLVNAYAECGCEIADLAPCEHNCLECEPAYKGPITEEGELFRMYEVKP